MSRLSIGTLAAIVVISVLCASCNPPAPAVAPGQDPARTSETGPATPDTPPAPTTPGGGQPSEPPKPGPGGHATGTTGKEPAANPTQPDGQKVTIKSAFDQLLYPGAEKVDLGVELRGNVGGEEVQTQLFTTKDTPEKIAAHYQSVFPKGQKKISNLDTAQQMSIDGPYHNLHVTITAARAKGADKTELSITATPLTNQKFEPGGR